MSTVTEITSREAMPVTVGGCTVYCDSFRVSAVRAVNEETTVDGESVITSSGLRAARLVFSGRIYDETRPLRFLTDISSPMSGGQAYTITYRGIRFTGCILQKYELTDSCRDWTEVSLTLITYSEAEVIQE
ncbi:MAG: hypothetical protein J5926_05240 [Ruminococcus sp.]|nr:hypothetical protein [Ruminococcus sp.]